MQAMAQAGQDVTKVFKVGKAWRFSVFDHASQSWQDSPLIATEQEAERLRQAAFKTRYEALIALGWQGWLSMALVVLCFVLFHAHAHRAGHRHLRCLTLLLVTGVLTPHEALAGLLQSGHAHRRGALRGGHRADRDRRGGLDRPVAARAPARRARRTRCG
jgi:hypothetical protein